MIEKITIGVVVLGLGYWAYDKNKDVETDRDDRYQVVMTEHNMSLSEAKALRKCNSQIRDKVFKPRNGITMTKVPKNVCICQAKSMAKHFKEDQYSQHDYVVDYVASGKGEISLNPEDLIDRKNPQAQFRALATSLNMCAYKSANEVNQKTIDRIDELCAAGEFSQMKCEDLRRRASTQ